jgi:hypothetical protein
MFASPSSVYLVTAEEDAVGDVELILNSSKLPIQQQAAAAAEVIGRSGIQHSSFLAEYIATLLRVDSDGVTAGLAQATENSSNLAFSPRAKSALLFQLWFQSNSAGMVSDNLVEVCVRMTARYFATESDTPDSKSPDIRGAILTTYIPYILKSERMIAEFRNAVRPEGALQFQKMASALLTDQRYSMDQKAHLQKLVDIMNTR